MDPLKFNENICRICLQDNVTLNWNEEIDELCGISYKDCYYKYTKLQGDDSDPLPKNLCATCSIELKNAYLLFEKASESFKFLCEALGIIKEECDVGIGTNPPAVEFEIKIIEDCKFDNILENDTARNCKATDIEENILEAPNAYDNEESVSTENCVYNSNSNDIPMSEDETIENTNLTRSETPPDLELTQSSDSKPAVSSKRKYRKYLCAYCSLVLCNRRSLKCHEATHSENRERTETCPQCGLHFYTKMSLKNHMVVHEEKREKKYKCEFCDKAFFNRGALNIHRRIHLGQMVACQLCPKEFYRQIDLDRHLVKHSTAPLHVKAAEKVKTYTVKCQYCNEMVTTTNWKTHKAIHLNQPPVKCKICNKDFFARRRVVRHLKQVHGKTIAECNEFIEYLNSDDRMTHLRIQQQEELVPVSK